MGIDDDRPLSSLPLGQSPHKGEIKTGSPTQLQKAEDDDDGILFAATLALAD